MKKFILSIIVSSLFFASNAFSFSLDDKQLSIGLSASTAGFYALGTETASKEDGTLDKTTKEAGAFKEDITSIFVEVGVNDAVTLGLDYVMEDITTPVNETNEDRATTQTASGTFSDLATIYAKIDTPFLGTYVKLGLAQADIKIKEDSTRTYTQPGKTTGFMIGAGIQSPDKEGFAIRAEITAYEFDDISSNNGVASSGNRNVYSLSDALSARGTISLVKSF